MDRSAQDQIRRSYSLAQRAQQAQEEIGSTTIGRWPKLVLIFSFLLIIFAVPLVQLARESRAPRAHSLSIFARLHQALSTETVAPGAFERLLQTNRHILQAKQSYEDDLRDESWITQGLRARAQAVQTGLFGVGNEKTLVGREGWLFYYESISHLTGQGFLEGRHQDKRLAQADEWQEPAQPDPVLALLHLRLELAQRGIPLVVVPIPSKPQIYPDKFSDRFDSCQSGALHNPSWKLLLDELRHPDRFFEGRFQRYRERVQNPVFAAWHPFLDELENGRALLRKSPVLVYDPAPDLMRARCRDSQEVFLKSDLHWRPEAVTGTAFGLARFLEQKLDLKPGTELPETKPHQLEGLGDIGRMLGLPPGANEQYREHLTINQVLQGNGLWRPERSASILLLGDSFSNIFSLSAMGWGEGAGLAEQLSLELRSPVDRIARNDRGAHQSRAELSRELSRGRDRLAGKAVVIYEFSARELSHGDWKLLPLRLKARPEQKRWAPESQNPVRLTATVKEVSHVPRPDAVPYQDHLCAVDLVDLSSLDGSSPPGQATVAYMQSMKDHHWTAVPRLRMGDRIQVELSAWDESAPRASLNRSDLDHLELQDHSWGILLDSPAQRANDTSATQDAGAVAMGWPEFVTLLALAGLLAAILLLIERRERLGKPARAERKTT